MRECHARCLHRAMVLSYRDARDAWECLRESSVGMQLEEGDFRAEFPPPTFKAWLLDQQRL